MDTWYAFLLRQMVANTLLRPGYVRIWLFFQISLCKVFSPNVPSHKVTCPKGLAGLCENETGLTRCEISQATRTYRSRPRTRNTILSIWFIRKKTNLLTFWGGGGTPPPRTRLLFDGICSWTPPQVSRMRRQVFTGGHVCLNLILKKVKFGPHFLGVGLLFLVRFVWYWAQSLRLVISTIASPEIFPVGGLELFLLRAP